MKVSTSSKKEPISKVLKIEEKLLKFKSENSYLRKQNRLHRKRISKIKESRDNWKRKNKEKSAKCKRLEQGLKRKTKPKRHHYGVSMIQLCVLLRVSCGCSYRSICKILKVLRLCLHLELEKIPCANTIENWVSKMGLFGIENAVTKVAGKEVCLMMDESLKLSNERVLLMLLTPSKRVKEGPLNHRDVEVGYLGGKKTWTGQSIQEQINDLIKKGSIQLTHILSDEDSKLLKATRLLGVPHLPDINHAIGNCLRKIYKKNEDYQRFIKLIGMYSGKSVNQDLTYLRPPKQRIKARFMNQKPVVKWALIMLKKFNQLNETEQAFFEELKGYKALVEGLDKCIELCEQIAKPLKQNGLCQQTLQGFKTKLDSVRQNYNEDQMIVNFVNLLEKYADQYDTFYKKRKGRFNVSSDVIESLFGEHKNLTSTNKLIGVSLLDLELPVHCKTENEILWLTKVALEDVFITDLKDWRSSHSFVNQSVKRKEFFKTRA